MSNNGIRNIVRIHQMLKRWRRKARECSTRPGVLVPAGHVAVCVGSSTRRFVVRATLLNHPVLRALLDRAEEEYGFSAVGPLTIPNCDESTFEEILRFVSSSSTRCHLVVGGSLLLNGSSSAGESWPLLRG